MWHVRLPEGRPGPHDDSRVNGPEKPGKLIVIGSRASSVASWGVLALPDDFFTTYLRARPLLRGTDCQPFDRPRLTCPSLDRESYYVEGIVPGAVPIKTRGMSSHPFSYSEL